jgi:hypothetical protein
MSLSYDEKYLITGDANGVIFLLKIGDLIENTTVYKDSAAKI